MFAMSKNKKLEIKICTARDNYCQMHFRNNK